MIDARLRPALHALPLFSGSDRGRVDALFDAGHVRQHEPGDVLLEEMSESTHLFVLLSGIVGVFYSADDGDNVLVKIFGAPAVFGEMELLSDLNRLESVEAFEACEVVLLPKAPTLDFLRTDAAASFALLSDVSRRLCIAAYNERSLAFHEVGQRLAGVLLSFVEAYGHQDDDGTLLLDIKLSYTTLARCVGATTRSVDRAVGAWLKEGWVTREKGRYRFESIDALKARVDEGHLALFSSLQQR